MTAPLRRDILENLDLFRSDTREWLEDNCPDSQRQPMTPDQQYWGGRGAKFPSEDARLWFERMRDRGWIVPEWPAAYGGGGLSDRHGQIIKEEMKRISARTPIYGIGIWMLGPAVLEYGTEEQKQQHIRAIVNGEVRWCQGYSEPGAGSDLASLQTRAEDMGDHFLVNGSKIWTTNCLKLIPFIFPQFVIVICFVICNMYFFRDHVEEVPKVGASSVWGVENHPPTAQAQDFSDGFGK